MASEKYADKTAPERLQIFMEGLCDLTLDTGVHIEGKIVQVEPGDVHPEICYRVADGESIYPLTLEELEQIAADDKRLNELRREAREIEERIKAPPSLHEVMALQKSPHPIQEEAKPPTLPEEEPSPWGATDDLEVADVRG